ncbi:MAG: serine hydrolase domain-containing protein [Vicinamibacterales bacterium]
MAADRFPSAAGVIELAISSRVFPGAVVEIGRRDRVLATITRGALTYATDSPAVDALTIYDVASLTKVLATTPLIMQEVEAGRMRLNDRVRHWIPAWSGEERQIVTIQDLLEHCAGLPANRPYYQWKSGREGFELGICEEPLDYAPRTQSIYTDLGFILLGFALEHAGGVPLDRRFDGWRDAELGPGVELRFHPPAGWFSRTAPTEDSSHGEELRGGVHDENARALGGVAGHAGLFGTAAAVGACARWWLARVMDLPPGSTSTLARFMQKSTVPGSSRALGWDTMLPTSSCGTRLSPRAIGHTGFTGTSLWIDPAQDLYVVLLSNRVHPTRKGEGIQQARRDLHDAIVGDLS